MVWTPDQSSFSSALSQYQITKKRAKALTNEAARDRAIIKLDLALDDLLVARSPDIEAFGGKLRILEDEYGLEPQPRHMGAIYADVASLAVIYAGLLLSALPR